MIRTSHFLSLLLAPLVALPLAAAAAPVKYKISTLAGPGVVSQPSGINSAGQVVGYTMDANANRNAFVSAGGVLTNLQPPAAAYTEAGGINSAGVVAGTVFQANGISHASTFYGGAVTDLGALGGPSQSSEGYAINASGQVTGMSYLSSGSTYHAFRYTPGSGMTDAGSLGDWSIGFGINDSGTVVGAAGADYFFYHAFSSSEGTVTDLGTLGGWASDAFAVNNAGVAVGSSLLASNARAHATMYLNGAAIDLGSLGDDSIAFGINNRSETVGRYDLTNSSLTHGFLYINGVMTDLNTLIDPSSGWTISNAISINDNSQIAAEGCNASGTCQGLLLTLNDPKVSPVPEPGMVGTMLLGLGLFGIMRRRKGMVPMTRH
jgi:probable HAF family extracellular repeat protein